MNCEATDDHTTPADATQIVAYGDHTFTLCTECATALLDSQSGARLVAPVA